MVTKDNPEEKSRVNVGPLAVNKETVSDLSESEAQQVHGGINANRSVNVNCIGGATAAPTLFPPLEGQNWSENCGNKG